MQGWIKLHRQLMTSGIFQNEKLLKVFIYCLLKATHVEHEQKIGRQSILLKPGQFVFGRKRAAIELEMKESTVRDYMNLLKDDNCLDIKSTNKYSVVTLVNWDVYQSKEENTDNNTASKYDTKKTTEGQQINTNKNVKELKNDKEDINPSSRKSKTYDEESIYFQLASRFLKNIRNNNSDFKEPNLQKWSDDFRLMMERDKRTKEQVIYLIDWCQQDSFWKTNILSPSKLRKQYDQLVIRIKAEKQGKTKSLHDIPDKRPDHWEEPQSLTQEEFQQMKAMEEEFPY